VRLIGSTKASNRTDALVMTNGSVGSRSRRVKEA